MQLTIVSLLLFFFVLTQNVEAQVRKIWPFKKNFLSKGDTTSMAILTYERPDWKTIDLDILTSYYAQDGNNSPVTGGIGTEQLTDFTQKIILSVPLKESVKLDLDGGYDYYSSASTDNIDNIRSSDSQADMRVHGNIGLSYQLDDQQTIGFRLGGSGEYDYTSINGGMTYNWLSKSENTSFNASMQAFIDQWSVIFPAELRRRENRASVPTDKRQSYNLALGFSQVLTARMQLSIQAEAIYMNGLLSTPFHRVYFQEQSIARIENLPGNRLKLPVGVRLNTYLADWLVARMYYRYYWDDWGMQGHTASLELPIKLNRFFSIAPFYRYHTQSAVAYFKPFKEHSVNDAFYTSDYDLSALTSHSYGVGVSYSPLDGIGKLPLPFKKRPAFIMKSVEFKYAHYDRSTGLKADIVSIGLGFEF